MIIWLNRNILRQKNGALDKEKIENFGILRK